MSGAMNTPLYGAVIGFIKPSVDVHTMGMYNMASLLRECGVVVHIAGDDLCCAVEDIGKLNNYGLIKRWIIERGITLLGFSYRLDPSEGCELFCSLYSRLRSDNMLSAQGGPITQFSFAGLPDTCRLVEQHLRGSAILFFQGNESPAESLLSYGIPDAMLPKSLKIDNEYDNFRMGFARELIESECWRSELPLDHWNYDTCGTERDLLEDRVEYARRQGSLPIIRTHSGPYNHNRIEALKEFNSWCRTLAKTRLLDVLSIGSSQLTQSNFGEEWDDRPNGGGVPINSELEYKVIQMEASPMLVRTYSGTKDVPRLAMIHERSLNIAWHALSFWWFNELDGRGKNSLMENLREHFEAVRYIVSTGKPVEPNVPHHFAFRGADDITYIVSGVIVAKALKLMGVKRMILQNMLNTPKSLVGTQDLAKGQVMVHLVREMEDENFRVYLQTRAGLDYFSTDLEEAMLQLASVTCMMDDIEPDNSSSPEIIHVVNYCEAVRLATPPVIEESIKITLAALRRYREAKRNGKAPDMRYDLNLKSRYDYLMSESRIAIAMLEESVPNLYSPEGFYMVFTEGFFPVPYLMDEHKRYPKATKWRTAYKDGGIAVVDDEGRIIPTEKRYRDIIESAEW